MRRRRPLVSVVGATHVVPHDAMPRGGVTSRVQGVVLLLLLVVPASLGVLEVHVPADKRKKNINLQIFIFKEFNSVLNRAFRLEKIVLVT